MTCRKKQKAQARRGWEYLPDKNEPGCRKAVLGLEEV